MQENKFVKSLRRAKLVQFGILLLIEIAFFLVLLLNPSISRQLYSNPVLFSLCAITWILLIYELLCLIYDFSKLRSFVRESHTLNKVAFLDSLTGLPNRHGLDTVFETYDSPEAMSRIGCCMFTIDNLMEINETRDRAAGDKLIQNFASLLEKVGDSFGTIGRNGGNDFLAVLDNCSEQTMNRFLKQLEAEVAQYNQENPLLPLRIRNAFILNSEARIPAFPELLIEVYKKLYP